MYGTEMPRPKLGLDFRVGSIALYFISLQLSTNQGRANVWHRDAQTQIGP